MAQRFKCYTCKLVIKEENTELRKITVKRGAFTSEEEARGCPICGDVVVPMCPRDHCHCPHDIISTIAYCPECGEAMCPECGSHDVVQISRVTGYLQETSGWNTGKQQELKDRTRYDPMTGEQVTIPAQEPVRYIPRTFKVTTQESARAKSEVSANAIF